MKPIKCRDYVIARDKNICRRCGRRVSEGHVHHIYGRVRTPRWLNVPNDDPHHPVNLVFLCRQCHFEVHNPKPTAEAHKELKEWKEKMAIKNAEMEGIEVIE